MGVINAMRFGDEKLFITSSAFISIDVVIGNTSRLLWQGVIFGNAWLVYFSSQLHRYGMLEYAAAVIRVLEFNDEDLNTANALKHLELLVTTRLRHASFTW